MHAKTLVGLLALVDAVKPVLVVAIRLAKVIATLDVQELAAVQIVRNSALTNVA